LGFRSTMNTGFKRIEPGVDIKVDLSEELAERLGVVREIVGLHLSLSLRSKKAKINSLMNIYNIKTRKD